MRKSTPIQWCDSTVNPVMGCGGCELWDEVHKTCYAGTLHGRRAGQKGFARSFLSPTLFPGRLDGGIPVRLADGHGGDWREWPVDLRVRQLPLPSSPAGPTRISLTEVNR